MKSPEFVLHGTSSQEGAEIIKTEGFNTKEGFPNVSENLIYAFKWATDKDGVKERVRKGTVEGSTGSGRIILIKVPNGFKVGYGDITEMNVDTSDKKLSGHVKNYVSGCNQLAFKHVNEEEQQSRQPLNIADENIIVSIKPTEELGATLKNLKKDIKSLEKIDTQQYADRITDMFNEDESNKYTRKQLLPIIENLVTTTVESEVVMMMRTLELNVLRAKGFRTFNNEIPIDDWQYLDKAALWDRLQELHLKSDTASFGFESTHIKRYIKSGTEYLINQLESPK